ncbi:MAG: STAS domain-containing protein [Gemmatimonadaceae bacterium]
MPTRKFTALDALTTDPAALLSEWKKELLASGATGDLRNKADELDAHAEEFLTLLGKAAREGTLTDLQGEAWQPPRKYLEELSSIRARRGYSSSQTATFVFSLKRPLFARLQGAIDDSVRLGEELWNVTTLIDELGMLTVAAYLRTREGVIARQQADMLELSTPVVKLWDGILALPMIGTLDSARTQVVMETLLERIVETGSEIAILDITGVPTVDTLVAQHLLKTVTAIRLMGADCIVSGVRPQIAQTIVHLGVNLQGILTKATLADALELALERTGKEVISRSRA